MADSAPSPSPLRPYRGLAQYTLVATPACALLALLASGWLVAWDGAAVSYRPIGEDPAEWVRVLLIDDAGHGREVRWPARAVEGLGVRQDLRALPPVRTPADAPRTTKQRPSLSFSITPAQGPERRIATTSPSAVALAALAWLVGLFLRNMYVSGTPLDLTPRPARLPAPLPAAGVPTRSKTTPGYQPPPPRNRRGRKSRKR